MIENTCTIRVRYAETDKMGYVYYGVYMTYFEVARVELIRELGLTYRDLEDEHKIMLPVAEVNIKYLAPAYYDDLLTIHTQMKHTGGGSLHFEHEVKNQQEKTLIHATVRLVFVNKETMRPTRPPEFFLSLLAKIE